MAWMQFQNSILWLVVITFIRSLCSTYRLSEFLPHQQPYWVQQRLLQWFFQRLPYWMHSMYIVNRWNSMCQKPMIYEWMNRTKKPIQIQFRYWIPHEWFRTDKSPRKKTRKKVKQKKTLAYNKIDFTLLVCTEKCFNSLIRWIYIRIPTSHDKCSVPIAIELRIMPQFVRLKQWN